MWSESVSGADGMREQAACVPRAERRMDRRGTRAKVQAWQELTSGEITGHRNQASAAQGRAGRQWGNNEGRERWRGGVWPDQTRESRRRWWASSPVKSDAREPKQ